MANSDPFRFVFLGIGNTIKTEKECHAAEGYCKMGECLYPKFKLIGFCRKVFYCCKKNVQRYNTRYVTVHQNMEMNGIYTYILNSAGTGNNDDEDNNNRNV